MFPAGRGVVLVDFSRAANALDGRVTEMISNSGLDPAETCVSFLVENSGSTRGTLAYHLAMSAMGMCTALEKAGVETTVMGYTTRSWKGGASREKWVADGKPRQPGRLEDLLHIVYKQPGTPMDRRALLRIAMIAAPELKKENVTGEGLMWAAGNVATLPHRHRLLVHVMNKPCSVSDSTAAADDRAEALFRDHLNAIMTEIDESGEIAMTSLVVGHGSHVENYEYHARLKDARSVVYAKGEGLADEVLEGFFQATSAAFDRRLEMRLENSVSADAADMEDNADSPEKSGPGL